MEYKCTKEVFLNDIKNHTINILHEEGLYRHIRFSNNGSSICYFDLITWPGNLCITGDCGTYVFMRIEDMFNFFINKKDDMYINPCYWSQKVISLSKFGKGVEEFSLDLFKENVKSYFDMYFEDNENIELKNEVWKDIENCIFYNSENKDESILMNDIFSFKHEKSGFYFQDFWEYNNKEYTFHYIWNCYAIVWGINNYLKFKKGEI